MKKRGRNKLKYKIGSKNYSGHAFFLVYGNIWFLNSHKINLEKYTQNNLENITFGYF